MGENIVSTSGSKTNKFVIGGAGDKRFGAAGERRVPDTAAENSELLRSSQPRDKRLGAAANTVVTSTELLRSTQPNRDERLGAPGADSQALGTTARSPELFSSSKLNSTLNNKNDQSKNKLTTVSPSSHAGYNGAAPSSATSPSYHAGNNGAAPSRATSPSHRAGNNEKGKNKRKPSFTYVPATNHTPPSLVLDGKRTRLPTAHYLESMDTG